jgi:hypothetical protein
MTHPIGQYRLKSTFEANGRIFMESSTVNGVVTVEERLAPNGQKQQRKILVVAENGGKTYHIPIQYLSPVTEFEERLTSEVESLKDELKSASEKGTEKVKEVLDKKYFGLSGKEIAIGFLVVLLIVKMK